MQKVIVKIDLEIHNDGWKKDFWSCYTDLGDCDPASLKSWQAVFAAIEQAVKSGTVEDKGKYVYITPSES